MVVSSWVTRGDPPKGTATAEYAEVHQVASEEAMDTLSKQKVPPSKRDYVKQYFDAIRGNRTAVAEEAPKNP